jgi:signal transduction histidine kinase
MTQTSERPLSLACVADQSATAAALHEALVALFPGATVERVDTDAERHLPTAIDCAVIDASVNGADAVDVLRRLRASGYSGGAVLVRYSETGDGWDDLASADRFGARSCELRAETLLPLATAVADSIRVQLGESEPAARTAVRALRQTQRLLAAGDVAMRLQHSLNNPLAALLAEAQLLELEPLAPDHRAALERIIELARRVVDVVRGLDGIGRA